MALAIVTGTAPDNAPSSGGTRVKVTGKGFVEEDAYAASFSTGNTRTSSSLTFINSTCLEWTTPAVDMTGKIAMRLETGGSGYNEEDDAAAATTLLFTFTERPSIASVVPSLVRVGTESVVTVVGSGFGPFDALRCVFDMVNTPDGGNGYSWSNPPTFVDPSIVQCGIPALAPAGLYSLAVSNNGLDFSRVVNASYVRVYDDVTLTEASVASGPVTGDTEVVVSAEKNLPSSTDVACSFGAARVRATQLSGSRIRCVSPPWDERESRGDLVVPVRIALNGLDFSASSVPFRYHALPVFETLTPSVVPVNSLFTLEVTGRYFASFGGLYCRFGAKVVIPARMMEAGRKLLCSSVNADFSGTEFISVEVSLNGGHDFVPSPVSLAVRGEVKLYGLSVSRVLEGASTSIGVVGAGFYRTADEDVICSYDHYLRVRGEFVNTEQIHCPVSPYMRPGTSYSIRVSLNGGAHFSTGWAPALDVYALPQFNAITPSSGLSTVTKVIEIVGSDFVTSKGVELRIACVFGDIGASVPAKVANESHLSCAVPSGGYISDARRVQMQFIIDASTRIVDSNLSFTFLPMIAVTRVYPTALPVGEPMVVFVWGFRFTPSRAYSIRVGDSVVESTLVAQINVSDSEAPASQAALLLSIDGAGFADTGMTVSLVHASAGNASRTVSSLSSAPHTASINVTICTESIPRVALAADYYCEAPLGGPNAGESVRSQAAPSIAGCLQCRMPSVLSPMKSTIHIVHARTGITIASTPFEWYEPPEVSEIWPQRLLARGSAAREIVVLGSGFRADLAFACSFQSIVASASTVLNESTAKCTLPVGDIIPSEAVVRVTNNRIDYSTSSVDLQVVQESIELSGISPRLIPLSMAANITVRGQHFVDGATYCFFSVTAEPVQAVVINNTLTWCAFPGVNSTGKPAAVEIALGATNEASTSARQSFMALAAPRITSIYPSHGTVEGNTKVTIGGDGFADYEALYCHFGNLPAVRAMRITSDMLECYAPPSHRGMDVSIRVSIDQQLFSSDNIVFTYRDGAMINSITPMYGSVVGGARITLVGRNFDPRDQVTCFFGDKAVARDVQVVSSTQIRLTSPSSASGATDLVKVTCSANEEEIESARRLKFQYDLKPQATHVEPQMGFTSSTTLVRVHGRGFSSDYPLFCLIGEGEPSIALVESESTVVCKAPPHRIGAASVRVALDALDTSDSSSIVAFEYLGTTVY